MSSLANNRRTKPTTTKGNGNDDIFLRSLKESLNSIILKDAKKYEEQRQRASSSSRSRSDAVPTEACYHRHRQHRLPATKQTSDEKDVKGDKHEDVHDVKKNDDHDHHPPRLIYISSLDTSSSSFARSSTLDTDTSFANSLDDSSRLRSSQSHQVRRSSSISTEHHQPHQQKEKRTGTRQQTSDEKDVKGDKHEDGHVVKKNDDHDHHPPRLIHSSSLDTSSSFARRSTLDTDTSFANSLDDSSRLRSSQSHQVRRSSSISTEHHQPHQQKEKRTVLRRKSIPRHSDSDLNSNVSSRLRPAKYTSSSSISSSAGGSSSIRSSALKPSFNSSSLFEMGYC
jgi:hypothetical protein